MLISTVKRAKGECHSELVISMNHTILEMEEEGFELAHANYAGLEEGTPGYCACIMIFQKEYED